MEIEELYACTKKKWKTGVQNVKREVARKVRPEKRRLKSREQKMRYTNVPSTPFT